MRLKTMCGLKAATLARMPVSSSWTPRTRTSCPISRSVSMTSYSIFHSASRTSIPVVSSGGTRWSCTRARMRRFFTTSLAASQEQSMSATVQVVHRLHGKKDRELLPCLFLRHGQAQLQLATAGDHLLENLVDG